MSNHIEILDLDTLISGIFLKITHEVDILRAKKNPEN